MWKWLSLWGIAVLAVVGICAFVPFFGIAVDATITNGPDLMVERILLIDVLAIAGAAGHRRLLVGISSFDRRMAIRMRYAKVGGTHMPGDTSELGAALAMNSPAVIRGYGGGLRAFTGGGGRFGMLGTRQRLMGALTSFFDGFDCASAPAAGSGSSTSSAIDCASRACALAASSALLRSHEPTKTCAQPPGSAAGAAVRTDGAVAGAASTVVVVEVMATPRAIGPAAMTVQTARRDRRTLRRIASSRAPATIGAAATLSGACLPGDMVKLPGQNGCF
ncbi:hypothetical protein ACQEV2_42510 [Streptomyces sp. CA-251387]|uniref:hypothetical protein n=1 Tax=Streptomyces sp. CA-251387 TaxID=3240064 RepID=UPI003D90366E